jgi:hypothetical protein
MAESAKKATIARASRIFERYDGIDVRSVKQITQRVGRNSESVFRQFKVRRRRNMLRCCALRAVSISQDFSSDVTA